MIEGNLNKQYGQIAFWFLFVLYWLGAWYIERIDFLMRPPTVPFTTVDLSAFTNSIPPSLQFFIEFFSPRVLRHLIPFALGWWFARQAALGLIQDLFDLPNRQAAEAFLRRSQSPEAPPGPPFEINRQNFKKDRLQRPLLRYGGPGRVRILPGDAIWTERNARFQRVLGPGTHTLERYEYVRGVLDLRPQERGRGNVSLITQDGIELRTDLALTFHISRGDERPTQHMPYPFSDEAVFLAGYAETIISDGYLQTWEMTPIQIATDALRDIVSKRPLDKLLYPANPELRPHELIRERLERIAQQILQKGGIDLVTTRLGRLEVPDEVTQQRIDYWRSYWQRRHRVNDASGEANAYLQLEAARGQARATAIRHLVEGIQLNQPAGQPPQTRDVIALRMVDALEKMARQSQQAELAPELASRISSLREQLQIQQNQ